MNKLTVVVAISALACGCRKKKPEEAPMPPPSEPTAAGSGSGSAGSGSAASAKPPTGDEMSKRFEQCWSYFNDAKWEDFKSCYAADAVYEMPGGPFPPINGNGPIVDNLKPYKVTFPDETGATQLELVSGHTIVAVTLLHGTMQAAMKTPMGDIPATKNAIGLYTTQVVEVNDAG